MNLLHELVEHKSVSLVGPLGILLDTGLGEKIDSADVVIRMGCDWPTCGKAVDASPDIGTRNDVVAIHAFESYDTNKLSELLDLKLVLWFTQCPKETCRYLNLMDIKIMEMVCVPETTVFTTVYLSLLESEASHIFVCGMKFREYNPNNRIFHENHDMRVECASHVGMMSVKVI